MRGVFLDLETYKPDERHRAFLAPVLDEWAFYDSTPQEMVVKRMRGADVVVTNKARITREILGQVNGLKLIVAGATGVDNIDVRAAQEFSIPVCNVRGYSTESVAQLAFSLILALANNLISYHTLVQSGAWEKSAEFSLLEYPLTELDGKRLGIIGYGDIGNAVARIGEAFGMDVMIAERKGEKNLRKGRDSFEDVLQKSDVVSLHCPLNDNTRGFIGAAEIAMMKQSAILINVSRGGIVDERALADALRAGEITAAGLDVLSQEPPRNGNPLLDKTLPNLIVTPHCAWASDEARLRMFEQIAAVIESFKAGRPMNVVV